MYRERERDPYVYIHIHMHIAVCILRPSRPSRGIGAAQLDPTPSK